MLVRRTVLCRGVVALISALLAAPADGHTGAGLAAVDQQVAIVVGTKGLHIEYITQLNRPAAFAEVLTMDTNRDGQLTKSEQSRYFRELADIHRRGLEIIVNGRPVGLEPLGEVQLAMPFRKTYRYRVPHPDAWRDGAVVELHNENWLERDGQLTLSVRPGDSVDVVYDSLAPEGARGPIAGGPEIAGPLRQRDVVFCYRAGSGGYYPLRCPQLVDSILTTNGNDALVSDGTTACEGRRWMFLASAIAAGCLATVAIGLRRVLPGRLYRACAIMLVPSVATAGLLAPGRDAPPALPKAEAVRTFTKLHRNIYRAFNEPTESAIYDRLAESLAGDALDQTYREVYQAVLGRGDGASFCVRRVKPIDTTVLAPAEPASPTDYRVRARWRVYGTVTHFSHTHARINEYEAIFTVSRRGDAWRITGVDVREQRRITAGLPKSLRKSAGTRSRPVGAAIAATVG